MKKKLKDDKDHVGNDSDDTNPSTPHKVSAAKGKVELIRCIGQTVNSGDNRASDVDFRPASSQVVNK